MYPILTHMRELDILPGDEASSHSHIDISRHTVTEHADTFSARHAKDDADTFSHFPPRLFGYGHLEAQSEREGAACGLLRGRHRIRRERLFLGDHSLPIPVWRLSQGSSALDARPP